MNDQVGWLQRVRARGLFAGTGYAALVTLGLMAAWDLDDFVWLLLERGLLPALKGAGFFFLIMALHQLPTVPVLAAGINLVPAAGVRRYLWLFLLWFINWAWCTAFFYFRGSSTAGTSNT